MNERDDDTLTFVFDLAGALHGYGAPSHRLESLLEGVGEGLGVRGEFFATPTAVFGAFGEPPNQRMGLISPRQWDLDLGRLAALDEIAQDVASGKMRPAEGSTQVRSVLETPSRGVALRLLCHAIVAGGAAIPLGGGLLDAGLAGLVGGVLGALELGHMRSDAFGRLLLPLGAFVATAAAQMALRSGLAVSPPIVALAGVIYLLPGLTLTVAMMELATGHLVSGTARLAKAFAAFFLLALGAASAHAIFGVEDGAPTASLPHYAAPIAVFCALPAMLVLLRVARPDVLGAALAMALAYGAAFLLRGDAVLAAGVGTLVLGLVGNLRARRHNRPAVVTTTPGLLLLVPGSVGLRAIAAFLSDVPLDALTLTFDAFMTAIALASGLLLANLAASPRKAL